ncbi:MAG TPA: MmcQ/YjbR family DNA-binding protein [Gemmatales bacterium]|nr:MmcQ/YjbR family DNA-binding protein [Gemmatales bacterium]
MTVDEFRALALTLPEAVEAEHMQHPDFRVRGKVFASIGPDATWGMVKLTPEQQALYLRTERAAYSPAAGAWGRRGYTLVHFAAADEASVRQALDLAWRNVAPKRLIQAAGRG